MSDFGKTWPEHWCEGTIGDIASYVQRGKSPRYVNRSDLPVVNQRCIRWDGIDERLVKFIADDQIREFTDERFLRDGDVLWNSTGAGTLGRAAVFRSMSRYSKAVADSHVTVIRCPLYDADLLQLWIRSPEIQRRLSEMHTGSTNQIELSRAEVLATPVPIPPREEQKRIAATVVDALRRVSVLRDRLGSVGELCSSLRQSILAAAFRGDLTADWREKTPDVKPASVLLERGKRGRHPGWALVPIRAVIESLDQGWSPKCEPEPASAQRWGVIKTTAIQPLTFDERENKALPSHLLPRETLEIQRDDLLITRAGPRTRAGVTCLVASVRPHLMICDKVYRIRVNRRVVTPTFMNVILNSPSLLTDIESLKTGISDSGVNLTQDRFLDLIVPVPPLAEQRVLTSRLDKLFSRCADVVGRVSKASEQLDQLEGAIIRKAFSGQLVPQDPNDEPASVLLERIRAQSVGSERAEKKARRTKSRGREATSEPEPAAFVEVLTSRVSIRQSTETADDSVARVSIEDRPLEELLAAIRRVLANGDRDRETLLRDAARQLGYVRTGSSICAAIDSAINTASRRLIIRSEHGLFTLYSPSIDHYDKEELKTLFLSAIGTTWWEREDAIRATARYLGFQRTGPTIDERFRSAINGLLRQNLLERDGSRLRKVT